MRSGASTIGRPHCAGCRDIHVCSTPVHQERIILAAHSFDTSVAHTHLKRTTPAHPEPARVETATCPLDSRFHSTDRPRSQEAKSMGPCRVARPPAGPRARPKSRHNGEQASTERGCGCRASCGRVRGLSCRERSPWAPLELVATTSYLLGS